MSGAFAYVWRYVVRAERRSEFLAAYGREGEWVRLFARSPAYRETRLLRDRESGDRFLTIDFWDSREARDAFRERYAAEFHALDRRCDAYTESENFVGDFAVLESDGT